MWWAPGWVLKDPTLSLFKCSSLLALAKIIFIVPQLAMSTRVSSGSTYVGVGTSYMNGLGWYEISGRKILAYQVIVTCLEEGHCRGSGRLFSCGLH